MNKSSVISTVAAIVSGCVYFTFPGCKKEKKDELPPDIKIYAPVTSAPFQLPFTLTVDAEVSDETRLESVTIQLFDQNMVPTGDGANVNVQSNHFRFTQNILIDNIHLSSGVYYLKVEAGDGENKNSRYSTINLLEIPVQLSEIFTVTSPSPGITSVDHVNNSTLQNFLTVSKTFRGLDVSSYYQHLSIAGSGNENLDVYRLPDKVIKYSLTPQPSGTDYFQQIGYSPKSNRLVVATGNNKILGYTSAGASTLTINLTSGYLAEEQLETSSKIYTDTRHSISGQHEFSIYHASTNTLQASYPVNFDILKIFEKDAYSLLLFVNENGQAKIKRFDIVSGNFSEPYSLPAGLLKDAEQADADNYFLATDTYILWYKYSTGGLVYLVSGVNPAAIAYEKLSGSIFSAEGILLKEYSATSGNLLNNYASSGTILDVKLLYNK